MNAQTEPTSRDPVAPTAPRATTQAPTPPTWAELSTQRWADASPGIAIPDDSWRWEVAQWPIDRWLRWHRRANELMLANSDASTIRAVQRLAFEQVAAELAEPSL